jgi:molybdopterin-guanine dinucleotide biosynthesis protein A
VVPAAGVGSRLGAAGPKLLVPVNGRPMLSWLLDLYRPYVDRVVVVIQPSAEAEVRAYASAEGLDLGYAHQASPTGMLDAILAARPLVAGSVFAHAWITWCDQIAIHPRTVATLAELSAGHPGAAVVMPTMNRDRPYIHLAKNGEGRIVDVLHRREGDALPDRGESDMGLFSLDRTAFLDDLRSFAEAVAAGRSTGERNFLPFLPWIASQREVVTFAGLDETEAIGVNTPEERDLVGAYLEARARA